MGRSVNGSVNGAMSRSIRAAWRSCLQRSRWSSSYSSGLACSSSSVSKCSRTCGESLDTRAELARMIIIHSPRADQWSMVQENSPI